ncbi:MULTISPECIES: hypothetical protein [Pseudomonas]|uniref:hypothetical protein n=1 Tax=Pseudomonas TaxID=286 RepID=UPI00034B1EFF|nr:hypothetical protein [Pseudomonas fluorescens]
MDAARSVPAYERVKFASLDNVLLLALANDELDKFLVGEPFYFQEAKNDNAEPQNVVAAFDQLVLRYWQQTHDSQFPGRFVAALLKILATYPDRNRAIYVAAVWVWYYQFCLSKKQARPEGLYADLFEIDMGAVALALQRQLELNKAELVQDTRWTGASWNSQNGLWGPLMRTALVVRDKLGGPDFVPANL